MMCYFVLCQVFCLFRMAQINIYSTIVRLMYENVLSVWWLVTATCVNVHINDGWMSFTWMCDECEAFTDAALCLTLDCFLLHTLYVYCCYCENAIEPAILFSKVGRTCKVFTSLVVLSHFCFGPERDLFRSWQKCLCAFGAGMMSWRQQSRSIKSSLFGSFTGRHKLLPGFFFFFFLKPWLFYERHLQNDCMTHIHHWLNIHFNL